MEEVYCFPEDALVDSQLNQSVHRAATFDMIRANGNIAGYNLTGMLDHALTGEGAVDLLAPLEAVRDGHHRGRLVAPALVPRRDSRGQLSRGPNRARPFSCQRGRSQPGALHSKRRHCRP